MVNCMVCVIYVSFIIHLALYNMQWNIALHMHGDITLNGCECMVIINTAFGV